LLTVRRKVYAQLSNGAISSILRNLGKRAGLQKTIYPHKFRHSRATQLASIGFTDMELRKYFGWTRTSNMPSVYVHLSSTSLTNKLKTAYGVKVEEDKKTIKESLFAPVVCKNCNEINSPRTIFCEKCGYDVTKSEKEAKTQNATEFFQFLLNDDEFSGMFKQMCQKGAEKFKQK